MPPLDGPQHPVYGPLLPKKGERPAVERLGEAAARPDWFHIMNAFFVDLVFGP